MVFTRAGGGGGAGDSASVEPPETPRGPMGGHAVSECPQRLSGEILPASEGPHSFDSAYLDGGRRGAVFARPLLPAGLAPAGSRDVILVIDTSLSTSQLTDDGSAWKSISANAEAAVESLHAGDFIRILQAADAPQWLTSSAQEATPEGKTRIFELLESVRPGQGGCRLTDALAEAVAARPAREKLSRRVVVFSDFQAESVKPDAAAAWTGVQDAARAVPSGCVLEAVASGPVTTPPNLAVLRAEVSREQAASGEVLLFSAKVKNTGPATTGVASLRWILGEVPSGLSLVPVLKAGAEATVEFSHPSPPQPGTATGHLHAGGSLRGCAGGRQFRLGAGGNREAAGRGAGGRFRRGGPVVTEHRLDQAALGS